MFLSFRGSDTHNNFTDHFIITLSEKEFLPSRTTRGFKKKNLSHSNSCRPPENSPISIVVSQVIMLPPHGASMKWLP
ncbi:hypothetical protein AHAS_Ahas15G0109000 [Arachis hypogaea]